MELIEIFERIDKIKSEVLSELNYLTPRQILDYSVKLAALTDTMGSVLAEKEQAYAKVWNVCRLAASTTRDADMMARELESRIKAVTEMVNALKKRGSMLELEAKNQQ